MNLRRKKITFAICCFAGMILFSTLLVSTQILKTISAMDVLVLAIAFGYLINAVLCRYERLLQIR